MEIVRPNGRNLCSRRRYYTGNDQPISQNQGTLFLEKGTRQIVSGRAYLCSFYAYVAQYSVNGVAADVWLMLFDAGNNVTVQDVSNPRLTWRIPAANQPDTCWYEPADAEIDEVTFEDEYKNCNGVLVKTSSTAKVGAFFEQGVKLVLSTTEATLTPLDNWGYVSMANFATLAGSPGGVA